MLENIFNNIFYKKEYKVIKDTIYFEPEFNKNLENYLQHISTCKKIVFMNNKNFFDTNMTIGKIIDCVGRIYSGNIQYSQFNKNVDILPNSLEEIYFGYSFDKPVDNLPENLIRIFFDNNFNQPVNKLPIKLKEIHFGISFNQSVDYLPNFLEKIYFEGSFNHCIDNLPDTLNLISLFSIFNKKINKLPKNLEYFQLNYRNNYNYDYDIPLCENLKYLEICPDFNSKFTINNKLENLICYFNFVDKINLPESLKSLTLYHENQYLIDNLPNSIEEIIFGWWWKKLELDNLPNSIKIIDLEKIDQNVMLNLNNLPNSVEIIKLPTYYNNEILKIPSNLKIIHCNKKYKFVKKLKKQKIKYYG